MATVKCKNEISINGEKRPCGKFLAILPQSVITALRDNPQDKIILRCHDCPGETKWIAISCDEHTGFTWKIYDDEINIDPQDEIHFDTIECSTIGG